MQYAPWSALLSLLVCLILCATHYVPQGLASLLAPYLIIHTTVSAATKACKQMGKFQRYGPTVSGKND
jgi:hypothetical protein